MLLNEYGQVLEFAFVPRLSFEFVENLFKSIADNLPEGFKLDTHLDICCSFSDKLNETLKDKMGNLFLDIWHAISRVTTTLPMTNPLKVKISREFKVIFRSKGDKNPDKERSLPTPSPDEIMENLEYFKSQFAHALPKQTMDAINRLTVHIKKGCLSGIPVSGGTNHNENLHKLLANGAMNVPKQGKEYDLVSGDQKGSDFFRVV